MSDGTSEEWRAIFIIIMSTELAPTPHRLGIPYRWAPWWVGVAGWAYSRLLCLLRLEPGAQTRARNERVSENLQRVE